MSDAAARRSTPDWPSSAQNGNRPGSWQQASTGSKQQNFGGSPYVTNPPGSNKGNSRPSSRQSGPDGMPLQQSPIHSHTVDSTAALPLAATGLRSSREGLGRPRTRDGALVPGSSSPYLQPVGLRTSINSRPGTRSGAPDRGSLAAAASATYSPGGGSSGTSAAPSTPSASARIMHAYGLQPQGQQQPQSPATQQRPVQVSRQGMHSQQQQQQPATRPASRSVDTSQLLAYGPGTAQGQARPSAPESDEREAASRANLATAVGARPSNSQRRGIAGLPNPMAAEGDGRHAAAGRQHPPGDASALSTSFNYEDIPEEEGDDGDGSSPAARGPLSGLTLDQYMSRMITTPASAAATSGLGVSSSSESSPTGASVAASRARRHVFRTSSHGRDEDDTAPDAVVAPPSGRAPPSALSSTSTGMPPAAAATMRASAGICGDGRQQLQPQPLLSRASLALGPPASGACAPTVPPIRISVTGQPATDGRGARSSSTVLLAPSGRGGNANTYRDGEESDDEYEGSSPSALLSEGSSRRLSARASALAFSNSLDLRPATAAAVSSPSTRDREQVQTPRTMALMGRHDEDGGLIKQVDLGGLSASLFTPTSREPQATTPSSTGGDLRSGPSSPDASARLMRGSSGTNIARPSLASMQQQMGGAGPGDGDSGPDAWAGHPGVQAVSGRPGSSRAGRAGSGPAAAGNLSSPSGQTSGGGAGAAAGGGGGRPASGSQWASRPQAQAIHELQLSAMAREAAREAAAAMADAVRPPTRQVQSARPPCARYGYETPLDPSVWQATFDLQLQRPPSRQKPPPEALHLWTPEQQFGMNLAVMGGGSAGGARRQKVRPQSAAPTTYRTGPRPGSGPSVKAQGLIGESQAATFARPPSRQRPPTMSALLEHEDFPPPPPGHKRGARPGAEQLPVVVSGSEDDSDFTEDELFD